MTGMNTIRVGIIGFGLSGRYFHAPLLLAHPGYSIKMVSTSREQEAKALIADVQVVGDPSTLIRHPDIDLIVNCAPNTFHFSYSAEALDTGKHVVIEKPFVTTVADGERLIESAARLNRVVSVFHNRRWDSDFLTVRHLIGSRRLGNIKHFESHMDRWRPHLRAQRWREQPLEGSGVFYDLGPHLIDQALELFGMPERIMADIQCQKVGGTTDDYFHVTLHYGSMRVILQSSSFSSTSHRYQIFGELGTFVKFGADPQESQLRRGLSLFDHEFGKEQERDFGLITDPDTGLSQPVPSERGHYLAFYDQLYESLTQQRAAPVTAEEALRSIRLIELAVRSSRAGSVVHI
jgi:scyllo-inositol 2-dehydrogenase (NADP+)